MTAYLMDDARVVDDLESVFRAHHSRLVRALTVACGDEQRAADAVQHAFIKAHLKWRRIQRYEDPVGWIRRVAINRLRDDHRQDVRKQRMIDRLGAERPVAEPSAAGSEVEQQLASLPRQQRLSLALYYIDGLSVAEIASTLGVSDGAIKFHLHQGRHALRGRMEALEASSGVSDD